MSITTLEILFFPGNETQEMTGTSTLWKEDVMRKKNCWDVMKCGRQPGGRYEEDFGVCTAATEATLNGVHGGHNAGRLCWAVAGTFGSNACGTFIEKYQDCTRCKFYKQVRKEEEGSFVSPVLDGRGRRQMAGHGEGTTAGNRHMAS